MIKRDWNEKETSDLIEWKLAGVSDQDIAIRTNRTFPSVNQKIRRLKAEGKLNIQNLSSVVLNQINYVPEHLTEDELQKLLRRAYLEFYFRPKIIFGLLAEIQSFEHLKNILRRVKRMWSARN